MCCLSIRLRRSMVSWRQLFLFSLCIGTLMIIGRNLGLFITFVPTRGPYGNDIGDFRYHWCRMQKWRVDWDSFLGPCEDQVAWAQKQVNSLWGTDAKKSFIIEWEIMPAGQFSRFFIQSVSRNGKMKKYGGDAWRVYIRQGPASLAPEVWDHNNGVYEVAFLIMEPGNYCAQITLDFTLCDGLRDPPKDWFIKGTIQGKYQAEGLLGNLANDYILESLGGKATFSFLVPGSSSSGTIHFDPEEYPHLNLPSNQGFCGMSCSLLHNGYGRWISNRWVPYIKGSSPKMACDNKEKKAQTLWVYGDSVNQRFLNSLRGRGICKHHFTQCRNSYMWIYELDNEQEAKTKYEPNDFNKTIILQHISEILNEPDMRTSSSVFLFNLGVHYSISLNFTTYKDLIDSIVQLLKNRSAPEKQDSAIPVWKTTTSIEKEKVHMMYKDRVKNATNWRFHTHQRLVLFHKYAVSAMCNAGIDVLDVYPMTASYPNGTLDHVHYANNVQRAAEDQLVQFVTERIKCAGSSPVLQSTSN